MPAPPFQVDRQKTLPIDESLPLLVQTLGRSPACVLRAAPGAGKTTRVPPALLAGQETGLPKAVWVLEPRRLAARAAARRIAWEQGWTLGGEVGYHVRFDRCAGASTRLLVMTEGVLLRRLQEDPFLDGVGTLIFDEFHERRLDSDLALAFARIIQQEARPDLRLVVLSATLDAGPVSRFLGDCPVLDCPGRTYPVTLEYQGRVAAQSLPEAAAAGVRRLLPQVAGDLLVFLPGVGEIRRTQRLLAEDSLSAAETGTKGIQVLPLFGDLSPQEQDRALAASDQRRVVLATNVAESSVTVEGVEAVIDTGYVRTPRFDERVGLERLETIAISRASADQRAGRAGRERPGRCLRLWSELEQHGRPAFDLPEVARGSLEGAVLQILDWGGGPVESFAWFEAPPAAALERAQALLEQLGAISAGSLTADGKVLARLPLPPRLGRLLLEAHRRGCLKEACLLAAELTDGPFLRAATGSRNTPPPDLWRRLDGLERSFRDCASPRDRASPKGRASPRDRSASRAGRLRKVVEQLRGLVVAALGAPRRRPEDLHDALAGALLAAYPDRLARRREAGGKSLLLVGGRGARLTEELAPDASLFLVPDLVPAPRQERSEARVALALAIHRDALPPKSLVSAVEVAYDEERDRVLGTKKVRYQDLVVEEAEVPLAEAEVRPVLEQAARSHPQRALPLANPAFEALQRRLAFLGRWMPELGLAAVEEAELFALLPALLPGKRSLAALAKGPWLEMVRGVLGTQVLQALDRHAPERWTVPSGRSYRLAYGEDLQPVLAVRIQELFGLPQTPRLAAGRVPVVLHLLAPNGRPQQITRDLASFWATTYREVRKELKGRYPKHAWPEDPTTAQAQRRPQRRP